VAVLNAWGLEPTVRGSHYGSGLKISSGSTTKRGGGAVEVQFRAAAEVHAALPPAARRPGGPALTLVGASGPAGLEEPLVCRVGGGAEERARCAPSTEGSSAFAFLAPRGRLADWGLECGGGAGGPMFARCLAPPSSGDAFDILTLGFTAETSVHGNSGEPGINTAGGGAAEIEYVEVGMYKLNPVGLIA
jgi:hypothetical protein